MRAWGTTGAERIRMLGKGVGADVLPAWIRISQKEPGSRARHFQGSPRQERSKTSAEGSPEARGCSLRTCVLSPYRFLVAVGSWIPAGALDTVMCTLITGAREDN